MPGTSPHSSPPSNAFLTSALWGVWWVDPRGSAGALRMSRLTFYRDFRFGSRSLDGRTQVYGSWSLSPSPLGERTTQSEPVVARLSLRFDRDVAPSSEYAVSYAHPPLGPIALHEGEHTRLVLLRAPAVDAALAGRWRTPAGTVHRGPYALDAIELGLDGVFALRIAGGVVLAGRWSFERDARLDWRGAVAGTLVLDPRDDAHDVERWPARVEPGAVRALTIGGGTRLSAVAPVEPAARALLGVWRRVAPKRALAPDELVLAIDGALELLGRTGTARGHGRWAFERAERRADALEGHLVIAIPSAAAQRVVHDRWHVRLPFARNSELCFLADGARSELRYRRLFR